jgi:hypothetical protein
MNKLQQGRLNKLLNKKVNMNGHIDTWQGLIDKGFFIAISVKEVPVIKYDRRKYNFLDFREQLEYEKRLKEIKKEYRGYTDDNIFYTIPKLIYDYCIKQGILIKE